jgi:serine/threonine protein kinase
VKWEETEENVIGTGPFSEVYRGTATESIRICDAQRIQERELQVAVKKLKSQSSNNQDQQMFVRQLEATSRARHPCCIRLVSCCLSPYAIAVERGIIDLASVFDMEKRSLPFGYDGPNTRTEWNDTKRSICAFGIAVGMCYLHEHGVMHRNLVPSNIFLDEKLLPRIGGFALSEIFNPSAGVTDDQELPLNIGTPLYRAPEMFSELNRGGKYSPAVDVFAYAMILYELLANSAPWSLEVEKVTPVHLVRFLEEKARPAIPDFLPGKYRELIEECWAQDAKGRPTFRQIVERTNNDEFFCFDETDVDEFAAFRDEMVRALNA